MLFKKLKSNSLKQTKKIPLKKSFRRFSVKDFFHAYISAIKSKALFFNYFALASTTTYNLLIFLEKNNRIAGYTFFPRSQSFRIFLSYDVTQNKPLIPKVTYYSSQSQTKSANLRKLKQFQIQNPNALTLIETHCGILDLRSCLLHKCGGQILISLA